MEKIWKMANLYLAYLRQIAIIHQHSHWTTKGATFYGDHLVFERIYKSASDDTDLVAEKFLGILGTKSVDYNLQSKLMYKISQKHNTLIGQPIEMSLSAEKSFLDLSKEFYNLLDSENKMTLGMDDMIMSIASNRESSCYLLQQMLKSQ